jgi:PST family polysaccharide transporter
LLVGNAISFVRTRSVDLIVGRGLGAQAVGVYSVGSEIANLPSTELIAPLNRVLLPAYSRLAGSDADLRRAFRTALGFIALLVAPLSILVAATATPIVDVFLGSQWTAAVPVVHALGWAGAAAVLQANTGSVFNAMGKPRLIAATGTLHCVTLLPMLVAGLRWGGTEGVALATLVHGVAVGFPVTYGLLIGNSPLCWRDVLAPLARPALASGIMYLGVEWGLATAGPSNHMLGHSVRLVGGIVGGALLYSATAALLWMVRGHAEDPEAEFVRWLRRALTRRR